MTTKTTPAAAFNAASEYQHIPLTPVSSNQIAAIGYDAARSTLALTFARGPGSVYHYPNFSAESFAALQAADSKGTFFGQHIKTLPFSKFEASVLDGAPADQAVTPASIAAELTGRELAPRDAHIPDDVVARAKAAGILIVCGASDDLVEFYGAWRDEAGADNNTEVMIDATGVLPSWETVKDEDDEEQAAEWHVRKRGARTITTLWAPDEPSCSWAYKTDIPHSTFDVMEDGELYCRGIVLAVADLAKA